MSVGTTLAGLMKSTIQGPAWHGPTLTELLEGVTAEDAMAHPLEDVHSIWELVCHINLWQRYTLAVLKDEDVSFLDRDNDWPEPEGGAEAWEKTCRDVLRIGDEIREIVKNLDEERMQSNVPDADYKLKVLLHGIVTYNVYHGGQITLIRKALERKTTGG